MTGINRHDYRYKKLNPGQYQSRSESWKLIVKAMYHGEWMAFVELQAVLKRRRSGLRAILAKMIEAGIMETKIELSLQRTKGRSKWMDAEDSPDGKPVYYRRDAFLPRQTRSYRLKMENITIQVEKKDPSE